MTNREAQRVVAIMSAAHQGCYHCAAELVRDFIKEFPRHKRTALDTYCANFEQELPAAGES